MKSSFRTREMRALHRQTGQWVDVAQSNARSAQVLVGERLTTQGIHMVQQSMEGATKAFAVANGVEHGDVRKQGHQNLKLLMMTMDSIVQRTGWSEYVNHMVGGRYFRTEDYDVRSQLARAIEVTSDGVSTEAEKKAEASKLYESAFMATPKEVKRLLWLFDKSRDALTGLSGLLVHLKGGVLVLELPPPRGASHASLTQQVIGQCRLPDREFHETELEIFDELEGLISRIIVDGGGGQATLNGLHLVAQFKRFMQLQTALLGILIIGAIVWPHESYPRYPAPPGAPRSLSAAVRRLKTGRRVGIEHYRNELGVVKHLNGIVERSMTITSYLRNIQDNYYLLEGPTPERS